MSSNPTHLITNNLESLLKFVVNNLTCGLFSLYMLPLIFSYSSVVISSFKELWNWREKKVVMFWFQHKV